MKKLKNQFDKMMKDYGWAAHYVPYDDNHINYHTHGLSENFNHPDLQIVLPISMENAHGIVSNIIDDIKEGNKFYENKNYKNGKMPFEPSCDAGFKLQLDVLED